MCTVVGARERHHIIVAEPIVEKDRERVLNKFERHRLSAALRRRHISPEVDQRERERLYLCVGTNVGKIT